MIKLKQYREQLGLSQAELSKKICISQQSISAYENGTREPDINTINLICDFFDISSDELLGRDTMQIAASTKNGIDLSDICDEDKNTIMNIVRMARKKGKGE